MDTLHTLRYFSLFCYPEKDLGGFFLVQNSCRGNLLEMSERQTSKDNISRGKLN